MLCKWATKEWLWHVEKSVYYIILNDSIHISLIYISLLGPLLDH
jgi:hypothetical protein